MPKLSVILPIYNAAPYLHRCLQSIRDQSFTDFEALCVNDGSTDSSLEIMCGFAKKDDRFVVLDKTNGGYGHSLNYGLAHATGDYIAIVEPDDFIDSHMFSDLLSFANYGGALADIIKGSYWEYFDGGRGESPYVHAPDLSTCMPDEPMAFTLEEVPEVFCHHPSIWSALYRREFLDRNQIRFVEPKGAGWADNPFLAETLSAAHRIVWVPGNYYYYRQSADGSSSQLKDFHIPFDRTREMRQVLAKRGASDNVLAYFYLREFDYIYEVMHAFDLQGPDGAELIKLVHEMLASMNTEVLHSNAVSRQDDIRFYDEFMQLFPSVSVAGTAALKAASNHATAPFLSFLVPVRNDAPTIVRCITSLKKAFGDKAEILCADCGSSDLSVPLCRSLAQRESGIRVLTGAFAGTAVGLNAAADAARGTYLWPVEPNREAGQDIAVVAQAFSQSQADVIAFDSHHRFAVKALCKQIAEKPRMQAGSSSEKSLPSTIIELSPESAADFILECERPGEYALVFKRDFLRETGLVRNELDCCGNGAFGCKALMLASSVAYVAASPLARTASHAQIQEFRSTPSGEPLLPDFATPYALALLADACAHGYDRCGQSLQRRVVLSFMYDLSRCADYSVMKAFCGEYLDAAWQAAGSLTSPACAQDAPYLTAFKLVHDQGIAAYLEQQKIQAERDNAVLQRDFDKLQSSYALKLGRKIAATAHAVVPSGIAAALKSKLKR